MKIILLFTFCFLVTIYACNEPDSVKADPDDYDNNCDPSKNTYSWIENKEIVITSDTVYLTSASTDTVIMYRYSTTYGNNIIFEYAYFSMDCDYIDDEAWSERLTFEIDKNLTEFEYTDTAIAETKCVYQKYGFIIPRGAGLVKSGIISGKKVSNRGWAISASVIITYPPYPGIPDNTSETVEFTGYFTKN